MTVHLTPAQRKLVRHALGFDNGVKVSYRNFYYTPPSGHAFNEWMDMVRAGLAHYSVNDDASLRFWVTKQAAQAALEPGEQLDAEDFG